MKEIENSVKKELQYQEENLWRVETRFDRNLMDKVFAEDFFEFGRSGRVWARDEILNATSNTIDIVLPLDNISVRQLSRDIYQVTYNSIVTYDGNDEYSRRSSIWSRSSDRWKLLFHQGTPYEG